MDDVLEALLRAAVGRSYCPESRGGMAGVLLRFNPFTQSWEAMADWSSGAKVSEYADTPSEAVSKLMAALTTPAPTT